MRVHYHLVPFLLVCIHHGSKASSGGKSKSSARVFINYDGSSEFTGHLTMKRMLGFLSYSLQVSLFRRDVRSSGRSSQQRQPLFVGGCASLDRSLVIFRSTAPHVPLYHYSAMTELLSRIVSDILASKISRDFVVFSRQNKTKSKQLSLTKYLLTHKYSHNSRETYYIDSKFPTCSLITKTISIIPTPF